MAATQLVELNHRHMRIAEYILANPSARLGEVAAAVGFSTSWVSIVVNSDIFREYLMQRNREISDAVHISLQEKMAGIAHRAVEKLGEAIDNSNDPHFILAAADKTLGRLGYGPNKSSQVVVNQNNGVPQQTTQVDITIVNQAREKMYALAGKTSGEKGVDALPAPKALPAGGEGSMGSAFAVGTPISAIEEAAWTESAGSEVRKQGEGVFDGEQSPADLAQSMDSVSGE